MMAGFKDGLLDFGIEMLGGFGEIFGAPLKDLSVLWQIGPVIFLLLVLQVYFATHKKEDLGWNTGLGNGISLFWVCVSIMQRIFSQESFSWGTFFVVLIVLVYSLLIMYVSFAHKLPSKIAFMMGGVTPVYFMAAITILVGYGLLNFSIYIVADLVVIFLLLLLLEWIAKKLLPELKEDEGGERSEFDSAGVGSEDQGFLGKDLGGSDPGAGEDVGQFDKNARI